MAGIGDVRQLGDFIREQRRSSNVSLRQLAQLAGVSNPYLSQIERGLRKPSAEILQQIAKGLRISAEALYVQAGFLEDREGGGVLSAAILADEALTERQKQVLLEIYDSFRKENAAAKPAVAAAEAAAVVEVVEAAKAGESVTPSEPATVAAVAAAASAADSEQPAAADATSEPSPAAKRRTRRKEPAAADAAPDAAPGPKRLPRRTRKTGS